MQHRTTYYKSLIYCCLIPPNSDRRFRILRLRSQITYPDETVTPSNAYQLSRDIENNSQIETIISRRLILRHQNWLYLKLKHSTEILKLALILLCTCLNKTGVFMKTSLQVISALTALVVFSGCPGGGGGKGDATPAVTVSGISGNGECTTDAATAYNNIRNYGYNSLTAAQVQSECTRLTSLIGAQSCRLTNQNMVIRFSDVQYQCHQANGSTGTITNPGTGTTLPNMQTKNVVCSIDLTSGSAAGSVSNMPVQVFANGGDYRLYANMQNTKSYLGGFINYTQVFSSEKLALLKLKFKAGNATTPDTLSLTADLRNGKMVTATGFAGSEVRIEIMADSEQDTSLVVSCAGQDQFNAGPALKGSNIRCSINENDNSKLTNVRFLNSVADLDNLGILPSKFSNLALEGNGQNVMQTSVTPTTAYESYKVVTSLVSPSIIKIKAPGYSLDSSCTLQ